MVILPKQILAKSSAIYAAKTMDVEVGQEIGFKHRGEKNYDKEKTLLLYTTDGTLVSMLMTDPYLPEYDAVIIDEAHERRTQTDLLLYLLKQVCIKRKDFKLIIMSATINEKIFADYYKEQKYFYIDIHGRTNFPIMNAYIHKPIDKNRYIDEGLKRIKEIIETTKDGDIIFFVPSIQETIDVCKKIKDNKSYCIEFFAGIDKYREDLAIDKDLYKEKIKGKTRKIVIATNVAESSVTIEGIRYVIDSGYEYFSYFNPIINSKVLEKRPVSKAQIKQRCGRTGRTESGICYRLYTSMEYEKFQDYPAPAIQTSNIYDDCLKLLAWSKIQTFDKLEKILSEFIEPPKKAYIDFTKNILTELKLIENNAITELGSFIADLPVEPIQGLAVCGGWMLNCAKEILVIVIMSDVIKNNINELFFKHENNQKEMKKFEEIKRKLMKKNSDHYSLLRIYTVYKKLKKEGDDKVNIWLRENYLKKDKLQQTDHYYKKAKHAILLKIKEYYEKKQIKSLENKDYNLKKRILAGLYKGYTMNVAYLSSSGYKTTKSKNIKISRDSWMIGTEKKRIMYTEMFTSNTQSYLQINSQITKNVIDLANHIKI